MKMTGEIPLLAERPGAMHKGQAGRVAVIAGARGMSGAAALVGLGALRAGAGLVRVLTPQSAHPLVAAEHPCLMVTPLAETRDGQFALEALQRLPELTSNWADVLAIGPGLGPNNDENPISRIVRWVTQERLPLVVDADALNAAPSELPAWLKSRVDVPTILTPHPGEMARLRSGAGLPELRGDDDDTRLRIAHEYAHVSGATVLLKGARSVVATADEAWICEAGNPGMATGGMGDVLTGICAALLGQGLDDFAAARLAAHVHAAAADRLARTYAPVGYLATEVADAVPGVLAKHRGAPLGFR